MKAIRFLGFFTFLLSGITISSFGQTAESVWTINRCIGYALQQNILVQQSELTKEKYMVNLEQAQASRFPSVSALANQDFKWGKEVDNAGNYGDFASSNSTSVGVSSTVLLHNGFKTENSIKQSQLSYAASEYDPEAIKESISLSVPG
jgi:outer membrane protein